MSRPTGRQRIEKAGVAVFGIAVYPQTMKIDVTPFGPTEAWVQTVLDEMPDSAEATKAIFWVCDGLAKNVYEWLTATCNMQPIKAGEVVRKIGMVLTEYLEDPQTKEKLIYKTASTAERQKRRQGFLQGVDRPRSGIPGPGI